MTFNATKIAAGTSLLGVGGVAGVLLAPQQADSQRAAVTQAAPPPVVRTIHIKRVHRRTIHEKPKPVHHAARVAAPAPAPAAAPVRYVAPAPVAPAPAQRPLRTRTSGSGGGGGGEHESEGHDD